jgi:hypothetical protein
MKWKFCEFCYINGHCENQDRGHKCECYGKKLEDKCERLEKQLKIAVEQLKDTYVICSRNKDTLLHTPEHNIIGGIERDCAIALQQIKELEK